MGFAAALVSYDLSVFLILLIDYLLVTRRSPSVIVKGSVVGIAGVLGAHGWLVDTNVVQFVAVGLLVMVSALFGYYNFLAFVKRGATFSMIYNRTRPVTDRRPDSDFIAIDQHVETMLSLGLIEGDDLYPNEQGRVHHEAAPSPLQGPSD